MILSVFIYLFIYLYIPPLPVQIQQFETIRVGRKREGQVIVRKIKANKKE